ncbi:MAG: hypothetical protein HQK51_03235 [Oligoflexia bacterium]|nr:hypothetical protein [Oligoflexia bacterium]
MYWQKKILSILTITFILLISNVIVVFAGGFDNANDPEKMALAGKFSNSPLQLVYKLDSLPKSSSLSKDNMPWSENYWPTVEGGLRYRFQTAKTPTRFDLYFQGKKKVKRMKEEDIAKLSPTEKIDIYLGDYDYTFTKEEIDRTKDACKHPTDKGWWGLCHGWASESLNRPEPKCVTVTNADGIKIKFGSSDLKGLALYFAGQIAQSDECFAGRRCNIDKKNLPQAPASEIMAYEDVNAGTFFLALTNLIPNQQGFVMDRTTDGPVWNQPIFGYNYEIVKESNSASTGSATGTAREVEIKLEVNWLQELKSSMEPHNNSATAHKNSSYSAILELDSAGNIIGGRWIGKSVDDHPDFIWMKAKAKMSDYGKRWEAVDKIYQEATK